MARPRHFNTVEELEEAAASYLKASQGKPTITGLALELGFESRQSFYDYEANGEFSYTIKRYRLFIESEYEKKLYDPACTGAIFALKNFGWRDKAEIEHSGGFNVIWNEILNTDGADDKTDESS